VSQRLEETVILNPRSDYARFVVRPTLFHSPEDSRRSVQGVSGAREIIIGKIWLLILPRSTGKDALLETAMALHDAAMKDDYFIKRKLAPNVDFWCVEAGILSEVSKNLLTQPTFLLTGGKNVLRKTSFKSRLTKRTLFIFAGLAV
jgi:hypothetical protein